jgi:hypothetical protein
MPLARSLALETKDGIDALTSSFEAFRFGKAQYISPMITMADQHLHEDEERKAIISALSPTDPALNHLEACRKHQKGTSDWLTKSEQYLKWIDAPDSVLWINGIRMYCPYCPLPSHLYLFMYIADEFIAGCGKTILW